MDNLAPRYRKALMDWKALNAFLTKAKEEDCIILINAENRRGMDRRPYFINRINSRMRAEVRRGKRLRFK